MDTPVINPIPVCEARTGYSKTDAFTAIYCYQTRGLRAVIDGNGHRHFYCAAKGHGENVRVRTRRNFPVETSPGELEMSFGR